MNMFHKIILTPWNLQTCRNDGNAFFPGRSNLINPQIKLTGRGPSLDCSWINYFYGKFVLVFVILPDIISSLGKCNKNTFWQGCVIGSGFLSLRSDPGLFFFKVRSWSTPPGYATLTWYIPIIYQLYFSYWKIVQGEFYSVEIRSDPVFLTRIQVKSIRTRVLKSLANFTISAKRSYRNQIHVEWMILD